MDARWEALEYPYVCPLSIKIILFPETRSALQNIQKVRKTIRQTTPVSGLSEPFLHPTP